MALFKFGKKNIQFKILLCYAKKFYCYFQNYPQKIFQYFCIQPKIHWEAFQNSLYAKNEKAKIKKLYKNFKTAKIIYILNYKTFQIYNWFFPTCKDTEENVNYIKKKVTKYKQMTA